MASSVPYDPDGFDSPDVNPFAQEESLSSSQWKTEDVDKDEQNDNLQQSKADESTDAESHSKDKPTETEQSDATQNTTNTQSSKPSASQESSTQPQPTSTNTPVSNPAQQQQTTAPKPQKKKYKLLLKVTGLERQGKKDPIIKFDAFVSINLKLASTTKMSSLLTCFKNHSLNYLDHTSKI